MQEKEYRCSKCKEVKTKEEMSLDATRRGGISSWCRICRSYSTKAWSVKNTDRLKVASKKKREDGYDYWKNRDYTLSYRYGLSLEKYDEMKKGQDDKCKICGKDSNEMTYHLFVDHNHKTGKVRGLLCSPCNAFIGHLKDDVNLIQRAIDYLKES